jgi:hypothetical protein
MNDVLHNGAAEQVAASEATRYQRAQQALVAADEQRRTTYGARSIGLLAMVAVGWQLWSKEGGVDQRSDANGDARGGIVVEITGTRTVDDETGEVRDDRAFRCVDPISLRQVTLPEKMVDLDRIDMFRRYDTVKTIVRMAYHLGRIPGRNLLQDEHRVLQQVADMHRLAVACTVGGKP